MGLLHSHSRTDWEFIDRRYRRYTAVHISHSSRLVEIIEQMDRISALRHIEDALADFEAGDADLKSVERRVVAVLRTYATDFGADDDLRAYRAVGDEPADGLVVVGPSEDDARDRVNDLLDADTEFELEIFK